MKTPHNIHPCHIAPSGGASEKVIEDFELHSTELKTAFAVDMCAPPTLNASSHNFPSTVKIFSLTHVDKVCLVLWKGRYSKEALFFVQMSG